MLRHCAYNYYIRVAKENRFLKRAKLHYYYKTGSYFTSNTKKHKFSLVRKRKDTTVNLDYVARQVVRNNVRLPKPHYVGIRRLYFDPNTVQHNDRLYGYRGYEKRKFIEHAYHKLYSSDITRDYIDDRIFLPTSSPVKIHEKYKRSQYQKCYKLYVQQKQRQHLGRTFAWLPEALEKKKSKLDYMQYTLPLYSKTMPILSICNSHYNTRESNTFDYTRFRTELQKLYATLEGILTESVQIYNINAAMYNAMDQESYIFTGNITTSVHTTEQQYMIKALSLLSTRYINNVLLSRPIERMIIMNSLPNSSQDLPLEVIASNKLEYLYVDPVIRFVYAYFDFILQLPKRTLQSVVISHSDSIGKGDEHVVAIIKAAVENQLVECFKEEYPSLYTIIRIFGTRQSRTTC